MVYVVNQLAKVKHKICVSYLYFRKQDLFNRFVTVLSHAADFIRNINFHHAAVAADAVVTIASVMCVSAITIICINTHSINIYIGECSSNKW